MHWPSTDIQNNNLADPMQLILFSYSNVSLSPLGKSQCLL